MVPLLTHSFQLIELWETFLLRLDAGEDGLPYYVPQSGAGETGDAPVSESTASAAEPAAEDEDEA
jgi:sorting nexin-1/2